MAKSEGKKVVHYEFGGPVGAFFTMLALPILIFFLHLSSSKTFVLGLENVGKLADQFPRTLSGYFSVEAFGIYCAWFAFNLLCERFLFADQVKGIVLPNGKELVYNINGHLQFWLILLFVLCGKPVFDVKGNVTGFTNYDLSWVYDMYLQLAGGAIVFACSLAVFLYLKSFTPGALLALGGQTGNPVYDFFIGRELNPRIGSWDLKEFCELRPGLIGWVMLNLGCAMKQRQNLGYVTNEMIMINAFQGLYVWDALYNEKSILTTMDITTDGFGWMLAFGDLAWVPFSYTLQARYLVDNPQFVTDPFRIAAIVGVNLLGYWIFRGSNSEKDAFRRDPEADEVKHLKYIKTSSGRKLLVSGWWGAARKINYTGDWLMGLSWCMCTGFGCIVPYFYSIYFLVLLVHRSFRDDHACAQKYGPDWPKYKQLVPYIFIPKVI